MIDVFFVHTPFQLFIAQQIIGMESLGRCVMIYGYVGKSASCVDAYEKMMIPSYWRECRFFEDLPGWAALDKHRLLQSAVAVYRSYKALCSILQAYGCSCRLWFGDMNNLTYKFAALAFHREGYKIAFFEEGTSHYAFLRHPQKGGFCLNAALAVFSDLFFYLPLFHFPFGRWRFLADLPFSALPMERRYSILPVYKESFDIQLRPAPLFSDGVRALLEQDCRDIVPEKAVLFMGQPIYDTVPGSFSIYVQVIREYVAHHMEKGSKIYVKFHPREAAESCAEVVSAIRRLGVQCHVLSSAVNIPIEYYLQYVRFSSVVMFYSSTVLYNGLLYPRVRFDSLLSDFRAACVERGLRLSADFEQLYAMQTNLKHN